LGTTIKSVVCPSCSGQPVIKSLIKSQTCETCNGSGKVMPGMMCFYCGRSVQRSYKGVLICGSGICQAEVDKKSTGTALSSIQEDEESYRRAWGMFQ
jgi:RecJ-like exonuclease